MAWETSNSDRDVGVQATQEGLTQIKNEADAKVEELQNQLRVITETDHDNGKLNITLDAKAGLSDLAKNFDPLQGWVSELNDPQQVTKGINIPL